MSAEKEPYPSKRAKSCGKEERMKKIRKLLPNIWKRIKHPDAETQVSLLDLLVELADYFENPNPMKAAAILAKFALLLRRLKEWPEEDAKSTTDSNTEESDKSG